VGPHVRKTTTPAVLPRHLHMHMHMHMHMHRHMYIYIYISVVGPYEKGSD